MNLPADPAGSRTPQATVECRWWAPGRVAPGLATVFAGLGPPRVDPDRVDQYLLAAIRPDRSVKIRDGSRRELKRRTARTLRRNFAPGTAGWIERWCKWSVPTLLVAPAETTLVVHKHRQLVVIDDCQVELTEVEFGGLPWHSVALEANDRPSGIVVLNSVVQRLVTQGLCRHMSLTARHSRGYPEQILSILALPGG